MDDWLQATAARLAATVGDDASAYALEQADVEALLELARVAAHDSGARTNAPLVCFLAGLACGRHPESRLGELVREVTAGTS